MSTLHTKRNDPEPDAEAPTVRHLRPVSTESLAPVPEVLPGTDDKTVISGRPVRDVASSSTPTEAASVLTGRMLDHFRLDELIGGGGMGAVFRARDTRLDRVVAVKVLPGVGQDTDLLRRFRVEAQSAARLDHPHIARIYDVGEQEGWHYIVFEYIEGFNVRDLVNRQGPLTIEQAVSFTYQAAEALQHAWQRGVVHRDVKPSNLLVDNQGHVRLVDMGLARAQALELSDDVTASNVTLGTFDYISPEQARDPRVADLRSDLYSLGCTLYFMLTGQPPYPGGTIVQKLLHHGSTPAPDPRLLRLDVSDDLAAIGQKLLNKEPSQRYQEASDLLADLSELARRERLTVTSLGGAGLVTTRHVSGAWWWQHLPWIVAVGMLIMSVVGLRLANKEPIEPPIADAPSPVPTLKPQSAAQLEYSVSSPPQRDAVPNDLASSKPPEIANARPFETAGAPRTLPSNETVSLNPSSSPNSKLVVSKTLSTAISGKEGVLTIADALRKAAENPSIQMIEVDVDEMTSGKLKIPRSGLTIQAASNRHPRITFDDSTTQYFNMQRPIMIDTAGHDVHFEGLHFVWRVPTTARNGGCLIQLHNASQLSFRNGSLTIENVDMTDEVFAFDVLNSSSVNSSFTSRATPTTGIRLENFIARGEMGLFHLDEPSPTKFSLHGGMIAISGSVLQTEGSDNRLSLADARIEFALERMTVVAKNLADVWLGPSGRLPPNIERNSEASIFVTEPTAALLEFHNLATTASNPVPWILGGHSNQYARPSDPLVRITASGSGLKTEWSYGDALKHDWFLESNVGFSIAWNGAWPIKKAFHKMEPDDYAQDDQDVGFNADKLPSLPNLPDVEFD